ncbi:MAG: MG2 domain-containing protein [Myxococcota bacterium]
MPPAALFITRVFAFIPVMLSMTACWPQAIATATSTTDLKRATSADLGGKERWLTHLSTDKPIYRENEAVYVRGVMLGALDHRPLTNEQPQAHVEIRGPKGDSIASGQAQVEASVLAFKWTIPNGTPGGEYTLKVSFPWHGYTPAQRTFEIRAYRAPRLKSQIVFVRDGYGPGDEVMASLKVERAEGGIPTGAKVTVTARVDGDEIYRGIQHLNEQGYCNATFALPNVITRGEGTLAMTIEDGGVVETASKTIPILLQTMDVTIFPEGGDLIAGLPNRVYVAAKTPQGKPADFEAVVIDDRHREIARFKTMHEGRGRFVLTPQSDRTYALKIIKPSGITARFALPAAKPAGVIIRTDDDIIGAGQPLHLSLGATDPGEIILTVSQREQELTHTHINVRQRRFWRRGDLTGKLFKRTVPLPSEIDGVLTVTVWDTQGNPLAERLVFRKAAESIHVNFTTDKKQYAPGDQVELVVTTTNAQQQPIAAHVGVGWSPTRVSPR